VGRGGNLVLCGLVRTVLGEAAAATAFATGGNEEFPVAEVVADAVALASAL